MSESKLKKQFAKKDVQRLRNLIQGKDGAKTTIAAGYQKRRSRKKRRRYMGGRRKEVDY